ncbi:hypothetical protein FVEG_16798 [Fusarium verticillioides 7600]|uniref:Uncharacterized protein n=1 Tax=Gibberella moniliformis (strain M3125 / FGSC 7600) TaxID=334819 RepID=W7MUX4_GIBM7|nr:hypothetical protein FVEG_16798 [Fusarium verticillioides 7600]EWG51465.1 hypothetical protein FVEG_16798 [Fusarium verticillioides 7600]
MPPDLVPQASGRDAMWNRGHGLKSPWLRSVVAPSGP